MNYKDDEKKLWAEYLSRKNRESLSNLYRFYHRRIISNCKKIYKNSSEFALDDYIQEVSLAFLRAVPRYENKQTSFWTYFHSRISGVYKDMHRKYSIFTRHEYDAIAAYKNTNSDKDVITDQERLGAILSRIGMEFDVEIPDKYKDPYAKLYIDELLSRLTLREEEIIRKVYLEGLTNAMIGDKIGLNESRVSQIKIEALKKLKLYAMEV